MAIFNDFINPLYFLPGNKNATVQLTLFNFQSQFNTQYNLLFMNILLITIPPLIMFIFFNRQIVAGLTRARSRAEPPLNVTVTTLCAEHHADPLGLGTSSPRLSWIVEADDDFRQHAYEVAIDDPDGDGSVRSTESRALGRVGARAVAVPAADVASAPAGACPGP